MIQLEVDARSLADLGRKLGPALYQAAVARALTDLAHEAEGEIKVLTPVVTGNLRRSILSDVREAERLPDPHARVGTETVYAEWIETGEDRRGRTMRTRPGGYRMFRDGAKAAQAKGGAILSAAVGEIEAAWGS